VIDRIRIPHRDPAEPFNLGRIADDIAASIDDPTERHVMREIAYELAAGNAPTTIGDAIELLEQATPDSRRRLLDRGRRAAGLPTLADEQAVAAMPAPRSTGVARDGQGRIDAICAEPGCANFEPGVPQFAKVDCIRWYCSEHRQGREHLMKPRTGPRYAYGPSGAIVDLDARSRRARSRPRRASRGRRGAAGLRGGPPRARPPGEPPPDGIRSVTLDRRRTARHEAGHVAAIILTLGRLPKLVRADWPHELTYGSVVFPWPEDRATQDLIGEFVVQQPDWPPTWPPDRDAASGDERQLGAAVSLGNIDEAGWDRLVEQATAMARSPDFNRLVSSGCSAPSGSPSTASTTPPTNYRRRPHDEAHDPRREGDDDHRQGRGDAARLDLRPRPRRRRDRARRLGEDDR